MKTKTSFTSNMYFCACILMSFWVSSWGSLKDHKIQGSSSRNHSIIYYIPNTGSLAAGNVCLLPPSLSAGHCKSCDKHHVTRSKDLFLSLLCKKKKSGTVLQLKLLTCTTLFPCWILFSAATVKTKWVVRFADCFWTFFYFKT